jgi:hypothetical protein
MMVLERLMEWKAKLQANDVHLVALRITEAG